VGQVAGVAGDDGGLVADGGHDDDRVDDVGGPGGGAGQAGGAAGALVSGEDVARWFTPMNRPGTDIVVQGGGLFLVPMSLLSVPDSTCLLS
jgi:hypothetical protein